MLRLSPSMPREHSQYNNAAFSLIEVILAGAIFVVMITGIITGFFYGELSKQVAGQRARATFIAEEGLEAARNIRDDDFLNLADGTFGLATNNGFWAFQAQPDTVGPFTRSVQITTLDPKTKQILSTVTWQETPQRTASVLLVSQLTNFAKKETWTNPSQGPCLNIQGGQNARKIDLEGNYVYFVTDSASSSFVSIDVNDPNVPAQVGAFSLQNNPRNVFVTGNYAYVASINNTQELQIVDISHPATPSTIGSFDAGGNSDTQGVFVDGTTAYIVRDTGNEFVSINVTNPASPTLRANLSLGGGAKEVTVLGQYAYVASTRDDQELQVVYIGNPTNPVIAASYNLSGTSDAQTIVGYDATVVVGRANGDISFFDVSTPTTPRLLGTYNAGAAVNDLAVGQSNTRIFAATANPTSEFQVLDPTNPNSPQLQGILDAQSVLNGVTYSAAQDIVYVVGSSNTQDFCSIKPQ